jgi:hemolysin activation/secretion protein
MKNMKRCSLGLRAIVDKNFSIKCFKSIMLLNSKTLPTLFCVIIAFYFSGLMGASVLGADNNFIPPGAQPSQLEHRFDIPLAPKSSAGTIIPPSSGSSEPPPGAENITFTLKQIIFDGMKSFDTVNLLSLYQDYIGTTISVAKLYDIAQAITVKYTSTGYILSQAIVPPQEIGEDGIAHIKIVEGYITGVIIKGDPGGINSLLNDIADDLRESRPLQLSVMERFLLLASDMPGVTMTTTLLPSDTTPETADLIIEIKQKELSFASTLDNRGGGYYGPWEMTTSLNINSPFDRTDQTQIRLSNQPFDSNAMRFAKLSHDEYFFSGSTKFSISGGYGITNPGGVLIIQSLKGESKTINTAVSYQIIRSRNQNLAISTGFDISNSSTVNPNVIYRGKSEVISSGASRAFHTSLTYDWGDQFLGLGAKSLISIGVSQGIQGLGASSLNSSTISPSNGHPGALKYTLSGSRSFAINDKITVSTSFSGQWSAVSLLSGDLYTYGGPQYGEGFDTGSVSGDIGLSGRAEISYVGPDFPLVDGWQIFAFGDIGHAWYINPLKGTLPIEFGVSVGTGMRAVLGDYISVNGDVSLPVSYHVPSSLGHPPGLRAFFGMSVRY